VTNILPLQQNFPITDPSSGFFTPYFKRYMDSLLARLGGITGGTYSPLAVTLGNIFWDLNATPQANVTLTNGTNIMGQPLNLVAGLTYKIIIIQPASGVKGTISLPDPPFRFPGGLAPTLSTANGAIDFLEFFCDGTNLYLTTEGLNYS
jgi:hypothetical protein